MNGNQKVLQYLNEAHASEAGLVRVLQSQIAMTPGGAYRSALEKHLRETRSHADKLQKRLAELGEGANPLQAGLGLAETVIAQALALGKTPLDLLRGTGGEEKVLKNAKDAAATEALEIATYTALERLAKAVGDDVTARLAKSIRGEEERMLARILDELPALTDAVVAADVKGNGSYDVSRTGAAQTARRKARSTRAKASSGARTAKRTARKVPGATRVEGEAKGAVAGAGDLPIGRYDSLTADEITARLPELSQVDLGKIDAYERRHQNRSTILDRVSTLRGREPWPGYDELSVDEIRAALAGLTEARTRTVRTYERAHKDRAGVIEATDRALSAA